MSEVVLYLPCVKVLRNGKIRFERMELFVDDEIFFKYISKHYNRIEVEAVHIMSLGQPFDCDMESVMNRKTYNLILKHMKKQNFEEPHEAVFEARIKVEVAFYGTGECFGFFLGGIITALLEEFFTSLANSTDSKYSEQ